jgi:hypothetical protein
MVVGAGLLGLRLEGLHHQFDEFPHALAVGAGDGDGLAQAQFVEFGGDHAGVHALGLVHRHQHRPAGAAQLLGDDLVLGRDARAAVHQEDHRVAFRHGLQGLLGHLGQDAGIHHRLEAAGIHHQEGLGPHAPVAVMAVPGQAGQVMDEGVPASW